jgi:uncharacterized membrane protein
LGRLIQLGRILFGIAIAGLGVEHLVCAWRGIFDSTRFAGVTVVPVIPWVPAHAWLACVVGLILIMTGLSLVVNVKARQAAILLGIAWFLAVLFLQATRLIASHFAERTVFFETLAICGAALTLAGALPAEAGSSQRPNIALDWLIKSGPCLFAISSIVFGVDHFMFAKFVASLIPPWIPWHLFWAYFTGVVFIATGVGIAIRWLGRFLASMLGLMFLLWFLLLHVPRVLGMAGIAGAPHNPNEWSSAIIALAMCGGSWICAGALPAPARRG